MRQRLLLLHIRKESWASRVRTVLRAYRELPTLEDVIRLIWEMDLVPNLKTHGRWQLVDVIHRDMFPGPIVNVCS